MKLLFLLFGFLPLLCFSEAPDQEGLSPLQVLQEIQENAEQGSAEAQYMLGMIYYAGEEVSQDYMTAFKWLHKSAEQGHADAQLYLYFMYYNGHGVPTDYNKAFKWCYKSANQGHAGAQTEVAGMYGLGQGVPQQDNIRSYMWYNLASSGGSELATRNKEKLSKIMSPEEIAQAQRLSSEKFEEILNRQLNITN